MKKCVLFAGTPESDLPGAGYQFYSSITDTSQLVSLDSYIRAQIHRYVYSQFGRRIPRRLIKGPKCRKNPPPALKSLVNEFYQVKSHQRSPCLCEIERSNDALWGFVQKNLAHQQFHTLVRKAPFSTLSISRECIHLRIGTNKHAIEKDLILQEFTKLRLGSAVSRVDLEKAGVRASSQVVTLISQLPGVSYQRRPIALRLIRRQPAPLLSDSSNRQHLDD